MSDAGWEWFAETQACQPVGDIELAKLFAKSFAGRDGDRALAHLRSLTLDRHLGPEASDAQAITSLAEFTESTLGPLYPPGKETAPNKILQASLNDLGAKHKKDDWQDLKLDGWIGPKTEEAYSTIASIAQPDEIAQSFGRSLRFI